MFTIVQRIGAIPRDPVRRGHHAAYRADERGHCHDCGAPPLAETGPTSFSPWLARARKARLLTEGL